MCRLGGTVAVLESLAPAERGKHANIARGSGPLKAPGTGKNLEPILPLR
jgi:hypothetical protein